MLFSKVISNYLLILLHFLYCSVNGDNQFRGSSVRKCIIENSGLPGICELYSNCKNAKATLRNHQIYPTICQRNNKDPIVCCSDTLKTFEYQNFYQCRKSHFGFLAFKNYAHNVDFWNDYCRGFFYPVKQSTKYTSVSGIPAIGAFATEIGEFPFMVAIGWKQHFYGKIEFQCGGFLLTKKFVLTAAHCTDLGGDQPVVVRTGGIDLDNNTSNFLDIPIRRIYVHPLYNRNTYYNDIALIELTRESNDDPKSLSFETDIGVKNTIFVGYGHTSFAGTYSKKLLQISLTTISNQQCNWHLQKNEKFKYGIVESQICAKDMKINSNQDGCQGDSGGPLVSVIGSFVSLIGLSSFGETCGSKLPSVYTRVSYYLDWIESIVWPGKNYEYFLR